MLVRSLSSPSTLLFVEWEFALLLHLGFRFAAEPFTFIEGDAARGRLHTSQLSMTQSCWMVTSVPAMALLSVTGRRVGDSA